MKVEIFLPLNNLHEYCNLKEKYNEENVAQVVNAFTKNVNMFSMLNSISTAHNNPFGLHSISEMF